MGIKGGFLPAVKQLFGKKMRLFDYIRDQVATIDPSSGRSFSVGVDAMVWLHIGCLVHASTLGSNPREARRRIIMMVTLWIESLCAAGNEHVSVDPVIYLDGDIPPIKLEEKARRNRAKEAARDELKRRMTKALNLTASQGLAQDIDWDSADAQKDPLDLECMLDDVPDLDAEDFAGLSQISTFSQGPVPDDGVTSDGAENSEQGTGKGDSDQESNHMYSDSANRDEQVLSTQASSSHAGLRCTGSTSQRAKTVRTSKRLTTMLNLKMQEWEELVKRSVGPDKEMLAELILACIQMDVAYVVAPYEADSQLAYDAKMKKLDLIVTVDADLFVYEHSVPIAFCTTPNSKTCTIVCFWLALLSILPFPLKFRAFCCCSFMRICSRRPKDFSTYCSFQSMNRPTAACISESGRSVQRSSEMDRLVLFA